jgi:DNA replication protein DnaC
MNPPTLDLDALLRRLHLPTVRRLYPELATRAEEEGLSYRDFLSTLMAEEVAHRTQTRIERAVRKAHFPFLATIEDFDFTFQSSVRLSLLGSFLGPELLQEGRCLVLCGPSGLGKTHLAVAIAYRAIQNGAEALFADANDLIAQLSKASARGTLREALDLYTHPHILVVDELGYLTYPMDAANVLFQVVNRRYLKRRPIVITTNKPLAAWGTVLHDPDLAEAILDRVLERGRLIELNGVSYRTRHLRPAKPRSPSPQAARISGTHRGAPPARRGDEACSQVHVEGRSRAPASGFPASDEPATAACGPEPEGRRHAGGVGRSRRDGSAAQTLPYLRNAVLRPA